MNLAGSGAHEAKVNAQRERPGQDLNLRSLSRSGFRDRRDTELRDLGSGLPVYQDLPINPSPRSVGVRPARHLTEAFLTVYVFGRPLKEGMIMSSETVLRRKTPVLNLVMLVAIAAVLATLPALAVATLTAVVPANVSGPLRVAAVFAPDAVEAGESINVRVVLAGEVVGPVTVNLQYAAYFATVSA